MGSLCALCGCDDATLYPARELMLCSPCGLAVADKMNRKTFDRQRWDIEGSTLPATYKAMKYVEYLKGEPTDGRS